MLDMLSVIVICALPCIVVAYIMIKSDYKDVNEYKREYEDMIVQLQKEKELYTETKKHIDNLIIKIEKECSCCCQNNKKSN